MFEHAAARLERRAHHRPDQGFGGAGDESGQPRQQVNVLEGEALMSTTSRRGFLGALALSGATLTAAPLAAAPEKLDLGALKKDTEIACLYHCDFGDPQRFSQLLTNINNHLSVYEFDTMQVKLVIVAHGAGIK